MLIKIGSALIDPEEIQTVTPDRNEEREQILIGFKGGCSCWIEGTMEEAEAALIDAGVMIDPTADPEGDRTPLPEMDEDEVEKLRELEADGYRYLARDKDGKLYAYQEKPEPGGFYWNCPGPAYLICGLSFISEDDKEPTEISRLLND